MSLAVPGPISMSCQMSTEEEGTRLKAEVQSESVDEYKFETHLPAADVW